MKTMQQYEMILIMHNFHRFLKLDSDDEEEEEEDLSSKRDWMMVERKADGTRFSPGQPTSPLERGYANRAIQLREDRPVPVWWKITQSLDTRGCRISLMVCIAFCIS